MKEKKYILISLCSLLSFFIAWYLVTEVFRLFPPQGLPSPVTVFNSLIRKFTVRAPDGGTLPEHIWASLRLALHGFFLGAVIGIPLGILMGWSRKAHMLITPIFHFLRPIPPIAWIPLMLVFFGIGQTSKAAVIFVATVTNCILNASIGVQQTKDVHLWVAQTFGASKMYILFKVCIPSALPMIFAGLNLSMNLAWMSLVAAEMLSASRGLGFMIQFARMMARVDLVIVGMITIAFVGAVLNKLLTMLENFVIKGKYTK